MSCFAVKAASWLGDQAVICACQLIPSSGISSLQAWAPWILLTNQERTSQKAQRFICIPMEPGWGKVWKGADGNAMCRTGKKDGQEISLTLSSLTLSFTMSESLKGTKFAFVECHKKPGSIKKKKKKGALKRGKKVQLFFSGCTNLRNKTKTNKKKPGSQALCWELCILQRILWQPGRISAIPIQQDESTGTWDADRLATSLKLYHLEKFLVNPNKLSGTTVWWRKGPHCLLSLCREGKP